MVLLQCSRWCDRVHRQRMRKERRRKSKRSRQTAKDLLQLQGAWPLSTRLQVQRKGTSQRRWWKARWKRIAWKRRWWNRLSWQRKWAQLVRNWCICVTAATNPDANSRTVCVDTPALSDGGVLEWIVWRRQLWEPKPCKPHDGGHNRNKVATMRVCHQDQQQVQRISSGGRK